MPIADPFQQQPDPDERPDAPSDAGASRSFGQPQRRQGERDRTRTRTRKDPQDTPQRATTAPQGAGQGPSHQKTPADDSSAAQGSSAANVETAGEVVPFPGAHVQPDTVSSAGEVVPAALTEAARAWWAEAAATGRQALDGSVWRARPPALRDSAARLQRAEWSGGLPLLRWAGWVYGYPALAVRAVLMGVIWLLDHPTRLIVLAGVIAAALYL